jgi:hypothetical protein
MNLQIEKKHRFYFNRIYYSIKASDVQALNQHLSSKNNLIIFQHKMLSSFISR